tara:strand:+ start:401 stop:574 length:174 start_codon:yes stop_codon:yes gene_type:complete
MKKIQNGEKNKDKGKKSKSTKKDKKEIRIKYEECSEAKDGMVIENINKDKEKGYDIV